MAGRPFAFLLCLMRLSAPAHLKPRALLCAVGEIAVFLQEAEIWSRAESSVGCSKRSFCCQKFTYSNCVPASDHYQS